MAKREKKTYNKIIDYLAENDEEMCDLFAVLFLEPILQRATGVTFLNPQDRTTRDELNKLAMSEDPAEVKAATQMLSAYIICDHLRTPDDFMAKHDDIPNALQQRVVIDRSASNSYEVVFGKGKATPCDLQTKKKIAVYNLTGVKLPTDGPKATFKYVKTARNTKSSKKDDVIDEQRDVSQEKSRALRTRIAEEVIGIYEYNMTRGRHAPLLNPFITMILSLIHFIWNKEGEAGINNVYKGRILPLLSFTPADFYIIFEPYRNYAQYLIPNSIIEKWYNTRRDDINMSKVLRKVWQDLAEVKDKHGVFARRLDIIEESDKIRQEVHVTGAARQIAEATLYAYTTLSKTNAIGAVTDVYPPELAELYAADPYRKALEDEMRYMMFNIFEELDAEFDHDRFEEATEMIASYVTGKESTMQRLHLLNTTNLERMIAPRERLDEVRSFVNSTMFMYIPLTPKETDEDFPMIQAEKRRPRKSTAFWNISGLITSRLMKVMPAETAAPAKDDPRYKIKQMSKQAKDGKLPKEVEEFLAKYNC